MVPIAMEIIANDNKDSGTVETAVSYNCPENPVALSSKTNETITKKIEKAIRIIPKVINNLQSKPVLKLWLVEKYLFLNIYNQQLNLIFCRIRYIEGILNFILQLVKLFFSCPFLFI